MSARPAEAAVRAILLDIEGTTTPIAFVYGVLFPYARHHLRRHLEQYATSDDYAQLFNRLRDEYDADRRVGKDVPPWADAPSAQLVAIAGYLKWLMDRDRKSTTLKVLQGRIWEEGYRRGELVSEVFADVPAAFERWRRQRVEIAIFSSGSVLAQQLLFRHSSAGDLTTSIAWYFDTTIGGKTDVGSYRHIAAAMTTSPEAILFVSDTVSELDAAREAGMQTRLAIRPGNKPPPPEHLPAEASAKADAHAVIRTFDGLVDRD